MDDSSPDLDDPSLYLNRELTWLRFDRRVLHQARDARHPLLERLKFLAISDSNLDEFVMKRIGGLKVQLGAGLQARTVDGRTPGEQLEEAYAAIRELVHEQAEVLDQLVSELAAEGIVIASWEELDASARRGIRQDYLDNVYPLVTPQAVGPAHPFPFISNLSLNLLCTARRTTDGARTLVRIKVPIGKGIPRFMAAPSGQFLPLEEVMAHNLDLLLPGMEVTSVEVFRVTRNANTEQEEEEADDLMAMIESELRDRKFAPIVRLEVEPTMDRLRRRALSAELGLVDDRDLVEVPRMLGLADLWQLHGLRRPELHDAPLRPVDAPGLDPNRLVVESVRSRDVLVMRPYESFASSVERFVREAARDPAVLALKMTLYRTSENTKILADLLEAARRGKQVTVVVELKARFDEQNNIGWASRLEEAGIHVTYGVVGLKTHCKTILVVRRDSDGLRRYAHIGTGNYHAGTAKLYTDLGLLTCDPAIGRDLTELFNFLTTGLAPGRSYRKVLVAPRRLKAALLAKIDREIAHAEEGRSSGICFKTNALEDADITRALYRASIADVRVDLIVRDTCRLRPGLPGISDRVQVRSVVGRFLEHSRIYHFINGGEQEFFIGSADCMTRNLESRVEVLTPIEDPRLQEDLRAMLQAHLEDRRAAWIMHSDGSYEAIQEEGARSSQLALAERCQAAHRAGVHAHLGSTAELD